ncbi:MAG: putative amidase AmiD [Gammaproteobacteria bacterium]|nr:putative amidase AmiD [Gammaproteobacteria bacterium]
MTLHSLGIVEAVDTLRIGRTTSESLGNDCLDRIHDLEPAVQAWAYLDEAYVVEQARLCDRVAVRDEAVNELHGIPIGIKDIVDTAGMPTEFGCGVFSGRIPAADAWLIERLKAAGAVIMGKTVTAEMATFAPGPTANPRNTAHTPGGSSSGSAAAVAALMVPGAVGSQTNGSMIRPASFCGVYGFKPTYGLIPRHGVLKQSPFLDQMGVFARSLPDVALLAETLIGSHPDDPVAGILKTRPPLRRVCNEESLPRITFGFARTAAWEQVEYDTRHGLESLVDALGEQAFDVVLPDMFDNVWYWHKLINEADIAAHYGPYFINDMTCISESLRGQIERGREVRAADYIHAMAKREALNSHLDRIFEKCDALITPAAAGEAPEGLEATGSPAFCTTWTLAGAPALSIPLLEGGSGLPIGVQLVGRRYDDARLLRAARWLERAVRA